MNFGLWPCIFTMSESEHNTQKMNRFIIYLVFKWTIQNSLFLQFVCDWMEIKIINDNITLIAVFKIKVDQANRDSFCDLSELNQCSYSFYGFHKIFLMPLWLGL